MGGEGTGYLPNTAARSLAVGRSSIIGLIVPDMSNPFFPEITKTFQTEASLYGMETVVMDGNNDPQRTRNMVERLLGLQVPGIAFLTSQVDPPVKEFMAKKGICAAYLGFGSAGPKIANIAIEQRQGITEAVNHLAGLGHRKVGFIGGPPTAIFAQRRKAAFLEAASAAGLETRVFDSDFTVQGGYFGCSRVLGGFDATAIMAANDLMAIGALHYAYDRQIAVPAGAFRDRFRQHQFCAIHSAGADHGGGAARGNRTPGVPIALEPDQRFAGRRLRGEDQSRDPPDHRRAAVTPYRDRN